VVASGRHHPGLQSAHRDAPPRRPTACTASSARHFRCGLADARVSNCTKLPSPRAMVSGLHQALVDPGDEQHVPQARLDRARARKELVRQRLIHSANAKLVPSFALLEQGQDALRALTRGTVVVNPS
jgi:hypothetical protein